LKSTETHYAVGRQYHAVNFSNFGSLKSTETRLVERFRALVDRFQQFRLVEEH